MSSRSERLEVVAAAVGGTVVAGNEIDGTIVVTDVTHDSRTAGPGCLFVAVRGFSRDGHDFVTTVAQQGASAVMVDHVMDVDIAQIVVDDTRARMATAAATVHHHPSQHLDLVAVTGTNGKTSVTHFLASIGRAAGLVTGVIGTLGIRLDDEAIASERTTPEAPDLQRILADMVRRGANLVAAEVSSHALALGRVDATHFAVGAFTNLSQDHLDFHHDMESYFLAKASLFSEGRCARAVVAIDDEWGRRLRSMTRIPTMTVSTEGPADLTVSTVEADLRQSRIVMTVTGSTPVEVVVPIPGAFSVANAVVAAGCALSLGVGLDEVVKGIESVKPIPGRFELVSGDDTVAVIVDYSHTPAGVEAAIAAARPLTLGRVLAVIGAGGDRDRAKRPLMGAAASAADLVVVTSDNPRSEPADVIMADVLTGVTAPHESIVDRRQAIRRAVALARPGDAVLLMGKGHEPYQEIGGVRHPFDDRVVAREELARARGGAL